MVQEQTGRISFEDILGIPAANMESIEPKKQSSSESVLPDPGAAENGQPPRQGVDNTVHRARRVSMWNVANLTVSFAKKLKKQASPATSARLCQALGFFPHVSSHLHMIFLRRGYASMDGQNPGERLCSDLRPSRSLAQS